MADKTRRVAFITGASSGIGRAAALAFAWDGVNVAAIARRSERLSELEDRFGELPGEHGDILPITADVQNPDSMQRAVQQTLEHFGRLDILIANAGVGHRGDLVGADWNDLDTLLRTNIDGVLHSIRAAVPAMRQTGGGHIVMVSSISAYLTVPYAAAYGASKAFISSIARSLRLELEADNIWVTDMLVGRTQTEFNRRRLGLGSRSGDSLPSMTAEQVAEVIVQATKRRKKTVVLRVFDRLILWGNALAPGLIGRLAKKQYR
jgi:short-subunit dehydrogenase